MPLYSLYQIVNVLFVPHRFWKEHSNIDVEKESLEAISALTFFDT